MHMNLIIIWYCTSHHIKYNFIQTLGIQKVIPPSWIAEPRHLQVIIKMHTNLIFWLVQKLTQTLTSSHQYKTQDSKVFI